MAKWTKHPSGVIFSEVQGEPGKQFQHADLLLRAVEMNRIMGLK